MANNEGNQQPFWWHFNKLGPCVNVIYNVIHREPSGEVWYPHYPVMNGNYFYFMVAYDIVQMKDDYSGVFSGMEEWGKSERQGGRLRRV